ncbi:MAG: hypothetical protein ABIQ61_09070 [Ornithinibacter sp.]
MPPHAVLPTLAALLGGLALLASVSYRLPRGLWLPTGVVGLAALVLPSVDTHYARNLSDLSGLAAMTACTFIAVAFASRSRVAQLSPLWRLRLDSERRRLTGLTER